MDNIIVRDIPIELVIFGVAAFFRSAASTLNLRRARSVAPPFIMPAEGTRAASGF